MQRTSEVSLKDAIERLLNAYKLKNKVQEARLIEAWESIVGRVIEKHTRDIYLKNNRLFIKIDSPVVRQELLYARTRLLEKVNQELGGNTVEEIIFL